MSTRSINKVIIIGNLTKDPIVRTDETNTQAVLFTVVTNRTWREKSGNTREEADYHRVIAWDKLGDLCAKFGLKGKKVYIEGRLNTRDQVASVCGATHAVTEIVANDVIFLDRKGGEENNGTNTTNASRPLS